MPGKTRMTKLTASVGLIFLIFCSAARAGDYPFLDGLTRYVERIDTLSVASGDAEDVNAVTQIIDPWPLYARDRRIPVNGRRMVGAVDRYQNPNRLGAQAPTLAPIIAPTSQGGGSDQGSAGMGGGGGQ